MDLLKNYLCCRAGLVSISVQVSEEEGKVENGRDGGGGGEAGE